MTIKIISMIFLAACTFCIGYIVGYLEGGEKDD